jgi:polyhydroxyalkanoate synthesis regulator phasin
MERLEELIERIKKLEKELASEIQKKEEEFFYTIKGRKVCFEQEIKRRHKQYATRLAPYLATATLFNLLTAPLIWACLLPALLLDLTVTIYHAICFPVYDIPRVRRSDYIVVDRHALRYLNLIEKINCAYCGYFNGLISYVQEIAARTEQYWCPIKHARKIAAIHSRYGKFLEYGDAEGYKKRLERLRQDFDDLKNGE